MNAEITEEITIKGGEIVDYGEDSKIFALLVLIILAVIVFYMVFGRLPL